MHLDEILRCLTIYILLCYFDLSLLISCYCCTSSLIRLCSNGSVHKAKLHEQFIYVAVNVFTLLYFILLGQNANIFFLFEIQTPFILKGD